MIQLTLVVGLLALVLSASTQNWCPDKCDCTSQLDEVYVVCEDLVKYPLALPTNTTHLLLKCDGLKNSEGQPIAHSGTITRIPERVLQKLTSLKSFNIASCPISQLPAQALTDLVNLTHVNLENTLITKLDGDIFLNSYNLREVRIERSGQLRSIDPILLAGQTNLRRISLSDTQLAGSAIQYAIQHLSKTLRHFSWKRSKIPVTIPVNTFKVFKFVELDLTENHLRELDFLIYTRAKRLILKGNSNIYQPVNFTTFKRLRHTQHLDLNNCNWSYLSGDQMRIFANLRVLLLRHNYLTQISADLLTALPKLRRLDISYNLITTLSESLRNFSVFQTPANNRSESVAPAAGVSVVDNRFHCNCEMSWILASQRDSLANQILCHSGNPAQYISGHMLHRLRHDILHCSRPSSPTVEADAVVYRADKPSHLPRQVEHAFYYTLGRGQEVTFRCTSFGDPAPRMTWRLPNGASITRQPTKVRSTTVNDVDMTIRQGDLTRAWANLTCIAENRAGRLATFLMVYNFRPDIILPPNNTAAATAIVIVFRATSFVTSCLMTLCLPISVTLMSAFSLSNFF